MKLSLLQENLYQALSHVSRFVSSKTQLPILNNILFSTHEGRLKLSATNLEVSINYFLGAKISQEGQFTVPARELTEFVSYLNPGKLDLGLDDKNLLTVSSPKAESTFTTIPSSDFPEIPSVNSKTVFEIDLTLLSRAVSQISFSAASDDSRPVLTGILCLFDKDSFSLISTDGFRLSTKLIKLVNPISLPEGKENQSFLIPARTLIEITKLSKNAKTLKIGLTPDENQTVFLFDDIELISRLIEGNYPDYQKIIPESFATKIFLNRTEFSQAVKIGSVFAKESANIIRFNVKKDALVISSNAPQVGRNQASVDARVEGESLEIAFNYKFISDFLNVVTGEEILIQLNENLTPVMFCDQSDPAFTHIIMPVRLQD